MSKTPRTDALMDVTSPIGFKGQAMVDLCRELEVSLSESVDRADKAERRLAAVMPLFEEARDALVAIPLASAKLRGVRLDLGDRMDDVGVPARWAARESEIGTESEDASCPGSSETAEVRAHPSLPADPGVQVGNRAPAFKRGDVGVGTDPVQHAPSNPVHAVGTGFESWWVSDGAVEYECDECCPHDACLAAWVAGRQSVLSQGNPRPMPFEDCCGLECPVCVNRPENEENSGNG